MVDTYPIRPHHRRTVSWAGLRGDIGTRGQDPHSHCGLGIPSLEPSSMVGIHPHYREHPRPSLQRPTSPIGEIP